MKDFIIVGRGLASACLMHAFHRADISFTVIGTRSLSSSSLVAAGIWNPLVFKRLTKSWMADELIPTLLAFYAEAETHTGKKFVRERHILRVFSEAQEQDLWKKKSKNELDEYLDQKIYEPAAAPLNARIEQNFGKVLNAGNLDIKCFLDASDAYFSESINEAVFDYNELKVFNQHLSYKSFEARNIIFCEGWLVKNNPWFSWLPLKPAKGEVLTLKVPKLQLGTDILNRNSFLFSVLSDEFKCGATYNWQMLDDQPTSKGRIELEEKVRSHTNLPFEVIKHEAGVRPAAIDRRPIIGPHPTAKNVFVFNGLGTKGVMLAPYFSQKFVHFYLQKGELPSEVGVSRFYPIYEEKTQGQGYR